MCSNYIATAFASCQGPVSICRLISYSGLTKIGEREGTNANTMVENTLLRLISEDEIHAQSVQVLRRLGTGACMYAEIEKNGLGFMHFL